MNYAIIGVGYLGRRVLNALATVREGSLDRRILESLDKQPLDKHRRSATGRRDPESLCGKVYAVSRSPVTGLSTDIDLPSDFDLQVVDLDDQQSPPVHLESPCCLLYTVPPGRGDKDVRLTALLNQLDTVISRMVYISTTGVYGDRDGALVSEHEPPKPTTDGSVRRLSAEKLVSEWCDENVAECILLRVPGIYGPGRLGLAQIESGVPLIRAADANPGNRIHVDDLADVSIAALQGLLASGVYNVGDGDYRSATWFSQTVARHAGLDAPPEVTRREAQKRFSKKRLSFLTESRRIDLAKIRSVLGFEPRYPDAEDGIRASLPTGSESRL